MAYDSRYYNQRRDVRAEHEKAWLRAKSTAWDEKWQALSIPARRAYLLDIKAPSKEGSYTQQSVLVDKVAPEIVEELTKAGLVTVEPGKGKKSAKIVASQDAYDFSARLRSMHRRRPDRSLTRSARPKARSRWPSSPRWSRAPKGTRSRRP
jgi:hypothetical protein